MQPNTKLYMHPRIGYRIYIFLFESQKKTSLIKYKTRITYKHLRQTGLYSYIFLKSLLKITVNLGYAATWVNIPNEIKRFMNLSMAA